MPLQLRRGTDAERTAGGGVVFLEGELIYITDTEEVYIGDGVTPGGLLVTGSSGLTNVVDDTTPALGGNLDLNNFNITGIGDIDITGTVTANFDGDVQGSVFGDDSTVLVDGVNNTLSASALTTSSINPSNNLLEVAGAVDTSSTQLLINSGATKASEMHFGRGNSLASDLSGDTIPHGRITFSRTDSINAVVTTAFIIARNDILTLFHNPTGNTSDEASYVTMKDANFGIGTLSPTEKLDVRGNAVFSGTVDAASFRGSVVADDSTTIIDGVDGNITAGGYVQFGSFTTIARNALTAVNGMVIYNTTDNKFQGYENGAWVNLV